jgi:hypothetical protein
VMTATLSASCLSFVFMGASGNSRRTKRQLAVAWRSLPGTLRGPPFALWSSRSPSFLGSPTVGAWFLCRSPM